LRKELSSRLFGLRIVANAHTAIPDAATELTKAFRDEVDSDWGLFSVNDGNGS
jgi:hypothetical protein